MKAWSVRLLFVLTACVSHPAVGAPQSLPSDIALQADGKLAGQLMDAQGNALPNVTVELAAADGRVAMAQTDQQGRFHFIALQGGVYTVSAFGRSSAYRLWAPHTAPPTAIESLLLVRQEEVVRGQSCGYGPVTCGSPVQSCGCNGGLLGWMQDHPVITAGAVAAAIAIPLSTDDDDTIPATP